MGYTFENQKAFKMWAQRRLASYAEKEVRGRDIKQHGILRKPSSVWLSMGHEEGRGER